MRTLVSRLTLWHVALFVVLSLASFSLFYVSIQSLLLARVDRELLREVSGFRLELAQRGAEQVVVRMALETQIETSGDIVLRLFARHGRELASTAMAPVDALPVDTQALQALDGADAPRFATLAVPGIGHAYRVVYALLDDALAMQIGLSLEDNEQLLRQLRLQFGAILAALVLLAFLVGRLMIRNALAGLEAVTAASDQITRGNFAQRVAVPAAYGEVQRLAGSFNVMAEHVESLLRQMREMTDNIAHDLKSPVTAIRGLAEIILGGAAAADGESSALAGQIIEECDRLLEMINTTLAISETESGARAVAFQGLDFADLVRQACLLFEPVAEARGIDLVYDLPRRCPLFGDVQGLQRMVANLLDNALKYTPAGGIVRLTLGCAACVICLSIRDTGIGIAKKDLAQIFNRFFRVDRSRSKGSSGLGLCLAMAVAKAHGGGIEVESHLDKGSEFTVSLPAATASDAEPRTA
jgi:signal transduction histidine kinase